MRTRLFFFLLVGMLVVPVGALAGDSPTLWPIVQQLQSKQFVDLTHAFRPGIPHWPGFDNEERTTTYYYDEGVGTKGKGFFAQEYRIPGQWGTHVDPPAHFVKGKRFLDDISVKEMLLPLVVIDVSEKVIDGHYSESLSVELSLVLFPPSL